MESNATHTLVEQLITLFLTEQEQLERWAAGESLHVMDAAGLPICCPDFSCCRPEMRWPKEERERFIAAGEAERERIVHEMLRALWDSATGATA